MCWIHFSQPALSTTFLSPVKSYFCLAASPVASLDTTRRSSSGRGQMSSLSCSWPCSVCWALSPFPAHALSPCTNPQSHPGCAHGTSSCPPHRSDCSWSLVIGKALYRLKTQTTAVEGWSLCFRQSSILVLWVPAWWVSQRPQPCVSPGRAGCHLSFLPAEELWGPLQWREMGTA